MKQKKTHQKVRGSKFPPFMRTQETHAFKRLRHCAIAAMMMFWSCTSTPLAQQTFFQLLHIKDPRTVDPLLNVVHRILIWPHLQRDKIWRLSVQHGNSHDSVTCMVNGMISVTSTLRHQVRDVHGHSVCNIYFLYIYKTFTFCKHHWDDYTVSTSNSECDKLIYGQSAWQLDKYATVALRLHTFVRSQEVKCHLFTRQLSVISAWISWERVVCGQHKLSSWGGDVKKKEESVW